LIFEKNANFFAENCRKSPKIVIITSTPDHRLFFFSSQIPGIREALLQHSSGNPEAGAKDSVSGESAMDGHHTIHIFSLLPGMHVRQSQLLPNLPESILTRMNSDDETWQMRRFVLCQEQI
jgi:hypothetical protein